MAFNRRKLGNQAERDACHFLQAKGLHLITQNYQCPFGEIDLIMRDKDDIVFIEVRSRSSNDYGFALESINKPKINKLIKTATCFLQMKKWLNKVYTRFDVVAIQHKGNQSDFEWIKNAFY